MAKFGAAGNDELFYAQGFKSTTQAPKGVSEMGLTAFEVCFGRGTRMSEETAKKIGEEAQAWGVAISAHAPYFINMANPESIDNNYRFVSSAVRLVNAMGGTRVVVHVGSQGDLDRSVALKNTRESLTEVVRRLDAEGLSNFLLCIETMGKYKQIGNYREVCELCSVDERVIPTLDFGHINCLEQGELQRRPQRIREILDEVGGMIGFEKLRKIHVHWSAIVFGDAGEKKHTTLDDADWAFSFEPLARYIKEHNLDEVVIICESKNIMAQDAVRLKNKYISFDVADNKLLK